MLLFLFTIQDTNNFLQCVFVLVQMEFFTLFSVIKVQDNLFPFYRSVFFKLEDFSKVLGVTNRFVDNLFTFLSNVNRASLRCMYHHFFACPVGLLLLIVSILTYIFGVNNGSTTRRNWLFYQNFNNQRYSAIKKWPINYCLWGILFVDQAWA